MLNIYYNLTPSTISKVDSNLYSFSDNQKKYFLYTDFNYDSVCAQLDLCSNYYLFYKCIYNKYNSAFTYYNNQFFILFVDNSYSFKIELLYNGYFEINSICSLNWRDLLIKKVDYTLDFFYSNKELFESYLFDYFNYYIYRAEMVIILLNNFNEYMNVESISFINYNERDFCNPMNVKLDVVERNFAEYLRILFIDKKYLEMDIDKLLMDNSYKLNYFLVLIRLIYPHYFFVFVEKKFNDNFEMNCKYLFEMINRSDEYEKYLSLLCKKIKKYQFIQIDI